jgi:putative spermidine/putrescine transport system substrate-binding protein
MAQPAAAEALGPLPGFSDWTEVLNQARGGTVRWYLWGGSAAINDFVDETYGTVLQEEFGIRLVRVPVADTRDVVGIVLSEIEAGKTEGGSVDLIWINGLNFYTLRQADLLYGPWSRSIPNAALVDWENPSLAYDFGVPVDGYESPWSGSQFQFIYDSARMGEADLPMSYAELTQWIQANPGRFTYVAPSGGAFQGTRFVKQALYEVSGGYEQFLGPWNQELFDRKAPALWELLNSWKPSLWRQGKAYPASENELHQLFANGEVDFTITLATAGAGPSISAGLLPPTARAFSFESNMIGDYNYVAIPANAANKAAAMVLANLILRPDRQALQIAPENGFGLGYGIDLERTGGADRAALEAALADLGPAAADADEMRAAFAPDLAPESQSAIEKAWETWVLRK